VKLNPLVDQSLFAVYNTAVLMTAYAAVEMNAIYITIWGL
jgi:hypothetical protein